MARSLQRRPGDGHPRAESACFAALRSAAHFIAATTCWKICQRPLPASWQVDAHERAGLALGMEQRARGQQVALVQHALGPGRRCPRPYRPNRTGPPALPQKCNRFAAPASRCVTGRHPAELRMRSAWQRSCPCSMHRARLFQQGRGGGWPAVWCRAGAPPDSAGPPGNQCASWAQGLREPAHIDGALQTIKRREARGVLWRDVAGCRPPRYGSCWLANCSTRWALPG